MNIDQVAIQFWTVRAFCKTTADYAATLKKVREIGYRGIELAGFPGPVEELIRMVNGEGLTICSSHESPATILDDTNQIVDRIASLGCQYVTCPHAIGDFSKSADIEMLIAKLEAAGAILHKAGRTLTYHNHANEFVHFNGKPLLETIYGQTRPENLQAELDTYWVQAGGADPVQCIEKLGNRLPLIHLKDYAVDATGRPYYAEIGSGNLDFKAIIAAAEAAGTQWFIVEQDTCPGDPFDCIKTSFEYIQANLVDQ